MPANPMQRKVRNSFLIGMIVMLLVALLVGTLLFMLVVKPLLDEQKGEETVQYTTVYKLKSDVKSGSTISQSMLELVNIPSTDVPSDKIIASNDGGTTKIPFIGGKAKINIKKGTILCNSLLKDEEDKDLSERLVEYNMITLPVALDIGDFVDVRISFANGQDLIIVAGKEVVDIVDTTVTLRLNEGEILMMNSAIVEAYILTTSNLYISKYPEDIEVGNDEIAAITYEPTAEVKTLMNSNSNITNEARKNFGDRFTVAATREQINSQLSQYSPEEKDINVESGIRSQIEKAKTARENYLSGI